MDNHPPPSEQGSFWAVSEVTEISPMRREVSAGLGGWSRLTHQHATVVQSDEGTGATASTSEGNAPEFEVYPQGGLPPGETELVGLLRHPSALHDVESVVSPGVSPGSNGAQHLEPNIQLTTPTVSRIPPGVLLRHALPGTSDSGGTPGHTPGVRFREPAKPVSSRPLGTRRNDGPLPHPSVAAAGGLAGLNQALEQYRRRVASLSLASPAPAHSPDRGSDGRSSALGRSPGSLYSEFCDHMEGELDGLLFHARISQHRARCGELSRRAELAAEAISRCASAARSPPPSSTLRQPPSEPSALVTVAEIAARESRRGAVERERARQGTSPRSEPPAPEPPAPVEPPSLPVPLAPLPLSSHPEESLRSRASGVPLDLEVVQVKPFQPQAPAADTPPTERLKQPPNFDGLRGLEILAKASPPRSKAVRLLVAASPPRSRPNFLGAASSEVVTPESATLPLATPDLPVRPPVGDTSPSTEPSTAPGRAETVEKKEGRESPLTWLFKAASPSNSPERARSEARSTVPEGGSLARALAVSLSGCDARDEELRRLRRHLSELQERVREGQQSGGIISSLRKRLQEAEADREKVALELRSAKAAHELASAQLVHQRTSPSAPLPRAEAELKELRAQYRESQTQWGHEIGRLQRALASVRNEAAIDSRELRAEKAAAAEERRRSQLLQAEVQRAQQQICSVVGDGGIIRRLEQERFRWRGLEQKLNKQIQDQQEQMAVLRRARDDTDVTLSALRRKAGEEKASAEATRREIDALMAEREVLTEELTKALTTNQRPFSTGSQSAGGDSGEVQLRQEAARLRAQLKAASERAESAELAVQKAQKNAGELAAEKAVVELEVRELRERLSPEQAAKQVMLEERVQEAEMDAASQSQNRHELQSKLEQLQQQVDLEATKWRAERETLLRELDQHRRSKMIGDKQHRGSSESGGDQWTAGPGSPRKTEPRGTPRGESPGQSPRAGGRSSSPNLQAWNFPTAAQDDDDEGRSASRHHSVSRGPSGSAASADATETAEMPVTVRQRPSTDAEIPGTVRQRPSTAEGKAPPGLPILSVEDSEEPDGLEGSTADAQGPKSPGPKSPHSVSGAAENPDLLNTHGSGRAVLKAGMSPLRAVSEGISTTFDDGQSAPGVGRRPSIASALVGEFAACVRNEVSEKELEEHRKKIADLEAENSALKRELQLSENEKGAVQEAASWPRNFSELGELKTQLTEAVVEKEALRAERDGLRVALQDPATADAVRKATELKLQLESSEKMKGETQAELETVLQELKDLKQTLEEQQQHVQAATAVEKQLQQQVEQQQQQLAESQMQLMHVQSQSLLQVTHAQEPSPAPPTASASPTPQPTPPHPAVEPLLPPSGVSPLQPPPSSGLLPSPENTVTDSASQLLATQALLEAERARANQAVEQLEEIKRQTNELKKNLEEAAQEHQQQEATLKAEIENLRVQLGAALREGGQSASPQPGDTMMDDGTETMLSGSMKGMSPKELREKCVNLELELLQSMDDCDALRAELAKLSGEDTEALRSENAALAKQVTDLTDEIAVMQEIIDELEQG
eukprot:Hpha_TRINITY_DN16404_c5_g1::TRINITY_DN16404_c5_g1_i2::g.161025::m.161025